MKRVSIAYYEHFDCGMPCKTKMGVIRATGALPSTGTALQFGEYVPYVSAPTDFTATMTITCTTTESVIMPWNGAIALLGAGSPNGRQLYQGSQQLEYRLYQDPARTVPWDDRGSGSALLPVSGTVGPTVPSVQTIIIYGRIPGRQTSATVGRYSDQITVLLDY